MHDVIPCLVTPQENEKLLRPPSAGKIHSTVSAIVAKSPLTSMALLAYSSKRFGTLSIMRYVLWLDTFY